MELFLSVTLKGYMMNKKTLIYSFTVVVTAFIIVSAYLLYASKAFSYLGSSSETCINCHVMEPYYDSWRKSSHARDTTCVSCHMPKAEDNLFYYGWYKFKSGYSHSESFTLNNYPRVMEATAESREIIQQNCKDCHSRILSNMDAINSDIDHDIDRGRNCSLCHEVTPHGVVRGLGTINQFIGISGNN